MELKNFILARVIKELVYPRLEEQFQAAKHSLNDEYSDRLQESCQRLQEGWTFEQVFNQYVPDFYQSDYIPFDIEKILKACYEQDLLYTEVEVWMGWLSSFTERCLGIKVTKALARKIKDKILNECLLVVATNTLSAHKLGEYKSRLLQEIVKWEQGKRLTEEQYTLLFQMSQDLLPIPRTHQQIKELVSKYSSDERKISRLRD